MTADAQSPAARSTVGRDPFKGFRDQRLFLWQKLGLPGDAQVLASLVGHAGLRQQQVVKDLSLRLKRTGEVAFQFE